MLSNDGIFSVSLDALFDQNNLDVLVVKNTEDLDLPHISAKIPSLALLDQVSSPNLSISECIDKCISLKIPSILLVSINSIHLVQDHVHIDDFIVAPFSEKELVQRIKLVISDHIQPPNENILQIGTLSINPTSYEVRLNNQVITLRYKEYELLRLLASNPGKVFSRENLLNQIWGYEYFGGTRTVDVHIRRIRSKIEDAKDLKIETVWHVGYRLAIYQQS